MRNHSFLRCRLFLINFTGALLITVKQPFESELWYIWKRQNEDSNVCVSVGMGGVKRLGGSPARMVWQSEISPG